jgi:hypothetical protein
VEPAVSLRRVLEHHSIVDTEQQRVALVVVATPGASVARAS